MQLTDIKQADHTASRAYEQQNTLLMQLADQLKQAVADHHKQVVAGGSIGRDVNWGHVGDLKRAIENIQEAIIVLKPHGE